jgi:glycosyltransferase involved in cell wall biosynthesis
MSKKISLIIPCLNEQEALGIFYPKVTKVLQGIDFEYELLFVNDGSRDKTLEILKELGINIYIKRFMIIRRQQVKKLLKLLFIVMLKDLGRSIQICIVLET